MNWVTKLAEQKYRVDIKGKRYNLSYEQLCQEIKRRLKRSKVVKGLLSKFKLDFGLIDKLHIDICDLEGRFAETDGKVMKLNQQMFEDGQFFNEHFFVVLHELFHYLSRSKEKQQGADGYFSDPEERDGFVISIAYEMEKGSNLDEIYQLIYPKISMHFADENQAREFFESLVLKANSFLGY